MATDFMELSNTNLETLPENGFPFFAARPRIRRFTSSPRGSGEPREWLH